MPTIQIGKTNKRINSTKSDFISGSSITLDVKFKEPTSSVKPVFLLTTSGLGSIGTSFYNYLKWGNWYYWIDDIIYTTNDTAEIYAHLDPLATFKSSISSTYALCKYADSSHWNKYVDDIRFSPEIMYHNDIKTIDMFGVTPSNVGCIIMTFTQTNTLDWMDPNHSITTPCGIHTGIFSISEFAECMGDLNNFDLGVVPGAGANEIIQAFCRLVQSTGGGSWLDNILRVIWLPFDYNSMITKFNATYQYGVTIGGILSFDTVWYEIANISIYQHSDNISIDFTTMTNGLQFLRNDRFNSIQISTPGGYSDIPATRFINPATNKLYFRTALSLADGCWSCVISSDSGYYDTLKAFSGCVGVNMKGNIYAGPTPSNQIAQAGAGIVTTGLSMGISNLIGAVSGEQYFNKFTGMTKAGALDYATHLGSTSGMDQLASGISGMLDNPGLNIHSASGDFGGSAAALFLTSPGGLMKLSAQVYAPYMIFTDPNSYEQYCDEYGYPCNDYLSLGSVSGFVQCAGASVNGAADMPESAISTINSYLNSGIYLE